MRDAEWVYDILQVGDHTPARGGGHNDRYSRNYIHGIGVWYLVVCRNTVKIVGALVKGEWLAAAEQSYLNWDCCDSPVPDST